jgi:quinohemoprotein ethanol dehydrogenase
MRRAMLILIVTVSLVWSVAHDSWAAEDQQRIRQASASIDSARIIRADKEPGNWLTHGRTYGEQRYSPLTQINTENVEQLGLAWYVDLHTSRGIEATPLAVDGILYTTAPWSVVYAIDGRSGELLWQYDPEVPKSWGKYACCDVINRGAALWQGKVYVGTIDGRLVALDAATGEVVWEKLTIDPTRPYTITGAPRVVKGKVIIGNGGAELGVRGYVSAYDADSGDLVWRFYTVPGDPSQPFENAAMVQAARTWHGGQWWRVGGGGTVWDSLAYDPELDLLYVGVGNGSPWSRQTRSPGGGDNLYLSSILALRPDTGDLIWYYQTTPGDTWDYTATQHMILADLEIDGRQRQVLMQAPKNGFFYVLDRATGELISAEKYVKVTWAHEVNLKTGRPVEAAGARYQNAPMVIYPSALGGKFPCSTAWNRTVLPTNPATGTSAPTPSTP